MIFLGLSFLTLAHNKTAALGNSYNRLLLIKINGVPFKNCFTAQKLKVRQILIKN